MNFHRNNGDLKYIYIISALFMFYCFIFMFVLLIMLMFMLGKRHYVNFSFAATTFNLHTLTCFLLCNKVGFMHFVLGGIVGK